MRARRSEDTARCGEQDFVRTCERLRSAEDIRQARQQGRSWARPQFALYVRQTELPVARVGVSTSRRLGNAVCRNRVRRQVREAVRSLCPQLTTGWDGLFVARSAAVGAPFAQIAESIEKLLSRAGVLMSPPEGNSLPSGGLLSPTQERAAEPTENEP